MACCNTTLLSSSSLTGDDVKNRDGEKLGDIKDIMIDTTTGRVQYYVLSFGGFLGMGDKLFAVPPSSISVCKKDECLVLDASKEQLENAPGFDKDDWPDMASTSFRDQIYSHYGYEYREAA